MASTYSTNLALELIGNNDQAGSWGNTTNNNLGTLIEQAISGYVTQAVSTGTATTITIPNGATGVARNMYIELTGTGGGGNTELVVPANKKLYFIFNNSTGAVTVKVSGQTGVSVPAAAKMSLVCNGTDVVTAISHFSALSVGSINISGITSTPAGIFMHSPGADTLAWGVGGSERMRLSSAGNFGIGTAAPVNRLDVFHAVNGIGARLRNSSSGVEIALRTDATTSGFDAGNTTGGMTFSLNTVERMRLDTSGNLGIGGTLSTTPSLNKGVYLQSDSNNAVIGYSLYVNDGANNRRGSMFLDDSAGLWGWDVTSSSGTPSYVWRVATAEVMRLNDSGKLGIGTSSPLDKLHVSGAMRQVFPSGFAGSGIVGAIDGVSNGFRVTNTAGNALSFTMQNGSNDNGFELDNSSNLYSRDLE